MAKPNYQYEKRARELAKKKKKEEKLKAKRENALHPADPEVTLDSEGNPIAAEPGEPADTAQ